MELDYLDYNVLASGSTGNAVRIGNVMIDCGISYSKMRGDLFKCNLLFITHIHSDHLNMKTYDQIRKKHKSLKTIANYEVAQKVDIDFIVGDTPRDIKFKGMAIKPFIVKHDVVTHGLVIEFQDETLVIYVTDSAGTDTWPKGKYDYLFLESNHDENIIDQVKASEYGYDVFAASKRHTSKQESKAFYYLNRKNKESEWIELHKSERFY